MQWLPQGMAPGQLLHYQAAHSRQCRRVKALCIIRIAAQLQVIMHLWQRSRWCQSLYEMAIHTSLQCCTAPVVPGSVMPLLRSKDRYQSILGGGHTAWVRQSGRHC